MKNFAALLIAAMVLAPALSFAYTINDPVNNAYVWPSTNPGAYDRIGSAIYELYGMDITRGAGTITFDIYTNFPEAGNAVSSWRTLPADLAFDLNKDGNYEYGVAFRSRSNGASFTQGTLYSNAQWYFSNHFDPTSVDRSYPYPGAGYVYHEFEIVSLSNGTSVYDADMLSWIDNDPGNDANVPDWMIRLVLDDSFLNGDYDFNIFYGGATCGNDFIGGTSPQNLVPEPGTMLMLGIGLIPLIRRSRKQHKS